MKRWLRRLGVMLCSTLLVGWAAESCFQAYLFSDWSRGTFHRQPELYADYYTDDLYWYLHQTWRDEPVAFTPHDEIGWLGNFAPEDFRHYEEPTLKGRRPILLFGDSFSACTPDVQCFEDIIEQDTILSQDFAVLNYGVGGYGIDQIMMLMENVLPLYPDAIVVLGMMTLDIDRAHLRLREAPKPKFDVVEGTLMQTHHAQAPLKIEVDSLLWRRFLRSSIISDSIYDWWTNTAQVQQVKRQRATAILQEMMTLTSERQVIPLVFDPLNPDIKGRDWRRRVIEDFWIQNDIPFVSGYSVYQQHSSTQPLDWFIAADGHPTSAYNRLLVGEIGKHVVDIERP